MSSIAITMLRVASLCAYNAGRLAGLVLLSALLLASPSRAGEDLAGAGTVEEWRAKLRRSELATASYAAGAMAMGNVFTACKNPRTVRELHTYLLYRALSTLTMKQAIRSFLSEAGCTMMSEDRFISSSAPQWSAGSPNYCDAY